MSPFWQSYSTRSSNNKRARILAVLFLLVLLVTMGLCTSELSTAENGDGEGESVHHDDETLHTWRSKKHISQCNNFKMAPIEPVSVLIDVDEFANMFSYEGVENCSSNANGLLNLKLIPQPLQQCPLTIPFARILCRNNKYEKFCVRGADGHLYTVVDLPPNQPVGIEHLFLYALCDLSGLNCQTYLSFMNFLPYGPKRMSLHAQTSNGSIVWHSQSIYPSSIGPQSGLLPITAVTCNGCEKIDPLPSCK